MRNYYVLTTEETCEGFKFYIGTDIEKVLASNNLKIIKTKISKGGNACLSIVKVDDDEKTDKKFGYFAGQAATQERKILKIYEGKNEYLSEEITVEQLLLKEALPLTTNVITLVDGDSDTTYARLYIVNDYNDIVNIKFEHTLRTNYSKESDNITLSSMFSFDHVVKGSHEYCDTAGVNFRIDYQKDEKEVSYVEYVCTDINKISGADRPRKIVRFAGIMHFSLKDLDLSYGEVITKTINSPLQ